MSSQSGSKGLRMHKLKLTVEEVKSLNGDLAGIFQRWKNTARIRVALKHNQTVAEYASTLLHELLHFWVDYLGSKGWKVKQREEHEFIEAVERGIYSRLKILKKGRKRDASPDCPAVKAARKHR